MTPSDTLNPVVTTSSVLGIKYQGGVMLIADTLASYGRMTRYKSIQRYITCPNNNTVLACSGEYSDFQMLEQNLKNLCMRDKLHMDKCTLKPLDLATYVSRVLYTKRTKMNPYYLGVVVAGFDSNLNKVPGSAHTDECYLGYIDMLGTFYADDIIATGLGRYFAITLLRERYHPNMSEQEARDLLEECMQILFYRDCAASNKIQIATITASGINVEEPKVIDSKWDYQAYTQHTVSMDMIGSTW